VWDVHGVEMETDHNLNRYKIQNALSPDNHHSSGVGIWVELDAAFGDQPTEGLDMWTNLTCPLEDGVWGNRPLGLVESCPPWTRNRADDFRYTS